MGSGDGTVGIAVDPDSSSRSGAGRCWCVGNGGRSGDPLAMIAVDSGG